MCAGVRESWSIQSREPCGRLFPQHNVQQQQTFPLQAPFNALNLVNLHISTSCRKDVFLLKLVHDTNIARAAITYGLPL